MLAVIGTKNNNKKTKYMDAKDFAISCCFPFFFFSHMTHGIRILNDCSIGYMSIVSLLSLNLKSINNILIILSNTNNSRETNKLKCYSFNISHVYRTNQKNQFITNHAGKCLYNSKRVKYKDRKKKQKQRTRACERERGHKHIL